MSSLSFPHPVRWRTSPSATAPRELRPPQQRPSSMERGERILLRPPDSSGAELIVTNRAVHLREADATWRRLRWVDIESTGWDAPRGLTVLTLWPDGAGSSARVAVHTSRRVYSIVSEAVAASRLIRRRVQLTSSVAAVITGLREPGDSAVHWRVDVIPPTARDEPAVQQAAEQAVAEIRALAGC